MHIRLSKNQKYIKPPKNRIKFERLLIKLGYRDRSITHNEPNKEKRQINYICEDGSAMAVYLCLRPYLTKKSYLYSQFKYLKKENTLDITKEISNLCKYINIKEKSRVGIVSWEVIYTKQPEQYNLKDRTQIIFNILKQLTEALTDGMCGYYPKPGDILAAKPYGPKINEGFNETSITTGTRQRYLVTRKMGFGSLYENGCCYAMYDKNLKLLPI